MKKLCRRCGRRMRKPGQRWCKVCHADYQRTWRRKRAIELAALREDNERLREILGLRGSA